MTPSFKPASNLRRSATNNSSILILILNCINIQYINPKPLNNRICTLLKIDKKLQIFTKQHQKPNILKNSNNFYNQHPKKIRDTKRNFSCRKSRNFDYVFLVVRCVTFLKENLHLFLHLIIPAFIIAVVKFLFLFLF